MITEPLGIYILQRVMLCFVSGFIMAALYTLFQAIRLVFQIRWLGTAVLDVIFFAVSSVMVFLCAFALNKGYLRFFQIVITVIGFCIFMLVLYPFFMYIVRKSRKRMIKFGLKIKTVGAKFKIRPKRRKKKGKPFKTQGKTKKGLEKIM